MYCELMQSGIENHWLGLRETELVSFKLEEFWARLESDRRSLVNAKLLESGLAHARGFLEAMLSVDLIGACTRRYIPEMQEIKVVDETVVAKITPRVVSHTLKIPEKALMKNMSVATASEVFKVNES